MPYDTFHTEAEQCGYDIEYLCQVFGVGYETVASRLSTLQRPNQRGIPFTFVRVDRAGNMSKRQSATGVHFSNSGGTCRCGMCTKPSRSLALFPANWRRCRTGATTCGLRVPSAIHKASSKTPANCFLLVSAARPATQTAPFTPKVLISPTCP